MKRTIAAILALFMLLCAALAEGDGASLWLDGLDQPDAVENVTEETVYDAADGLSGAGVVNGDPGDATMEERITYSFTPLDVVLVLDVSGSMTTSNQNTGKMLLTYAQDAAIAFCNTLYSINPSSRVAVVSYDSYVNTVCGLTGLGGAASVSSGIRGMSPGGMTNIGGGYQRALELLDSGARPDAKRVTLLLTDGLANDGASDPVAYAIAQGSANAAKGLVYTVGLVGGMSSSERSVTRHTLNEGYETRYYEVDFDDVQDISAVLSSAFVTIATCGGADADMEVYRLSVSDGVDVRIEDGSGDYLSSAPNDVRTKAAFGALSLLGESLDEKLAVLPQGDYSIRFHARTTTKLDFDLSSISENGARENSLCKGTEDVHPGMCSILSLDDGKATREDIAYNPIDPDAHDPFTGQRTLGLEYAALGVVNGKVPVLVAPKKGCATIATLANGTTTSVLALDTSAGYYLVSDMVKDTKPFRGWVRKESLSVSGYVPEMFYMDKTATLARDTNAFYAPNDYSLDAGELKAGASLRVLHAERDAGNREYVYVQCPGSKVKYAYVPADALKDWTPATPDDFALGYLDASFMWQTVLGGSGYTELMWAETDPDGSGVVLSGRSTSKQGGINAKNGDRDALALRLSSAGKVEKLVTMGGSAVDSFHCIRPVAEGFLVSGITRSNDKDFKRIWSKDTTKGSVSGSKTSRSNALVGMLDDNFKPLFLKSMGTGETSYGFDMVVELADGNIAGVGWMTDDSKTVLPRNGKQDFYAVKMDRDGNILRQRNYGTGGNDVPDCAWATPDGGLIFVGSRFGDDKTGYILVLDSDLNVVNECLYGGSGDDVFDNVRLLSDGTYLVTGFTNSPSSSGVGTSKGGFDFWAMNIDAMGRCIWTRRYGGSGDEELCGTTVLDNGMIVLVGSTNSDDGDVHATRGIRQKDGWAIGIDVTGRLLWQFCFGTTDDDWFNSAALDAGDGGVVLAGACQGKDSKTAKGFAVKICLPAYQTDMSSVLVLGN